MAKKMESPSWRLEEKEEKRENEGEDEGWEQSLDYILLPVPRSLPSVMATRLA